MPAHHLEHFVAAHQLVVGQVDHAHAAPAELALDFVIGVVGQARRERVGGDRGRACRSFIALRPVELRLARHRTCLSASGVADPAEKAVGRHLGDPLPALGALLQMLVDGLGRTIVELAQAEGAQGLVASGGGTGRRPSGGLRRRVD